MKLPHNSPDVKSISEENYVLVKARGNLCWCSWDVILFRLFPLCTAEQLERQKTTRLWIFFFFHSGAFFASIFPFCFLIPPPFSLFIAGDSKLPYNNPVMIAAMISTSVKAVQTGTEMISLRTVPEGAGYSFWVLPDAGQGQSGYSSLVNVPAKQWQASWN